MNNGGELTQAKCDPRLVAFTFLAVLMANVLCSIYASIEARGLYADAAALLVTLYGAKSFLVSWGPRAAVETLRQAPIVLLSKDTSATLFQCGQVLSFIMLVLPTVLTSTCWLIAPRGQRAWVLFPLAFLLIGFAATSMHAVGEASIATSCYWILLFILLFRTRSTSGKAFFLLLSLVAFWLHEGAFLLTILLLTCLVTRVCSLAQYRRERLFVVVAALLLIAVLVYQVHFVIYPRYPDDRAHIIRGLLHFEFLYVDGHFNLPVITGCLAVVTLSFLVAFRANWPSSATAAREKLLIIVWLSLVVIAILAAIFVEQSFSAFAQLQARYHPVFVSAALGGAMILLIRLRMPQQLWMQPATCFVLLTLCIAQVVADVVATNCWEAYLSDLQSRLEKGKGLIPWESTLQTGDMLVDANWRLFEIGWVVPYNCIIFAPSGVVSAIIDLPQGTTFRPLDPERPDRIPELTSIDFAPYRNSVAGQQSNAVTPQR